METCEHDSPVQCASHEQHIHPEIEHPMSSQQDVHYGENIPAQQMQVVLVSNRIMFMLITMEYCCVY